MLLVAKPWRGGLADYLYQALTEIVPGSVEWWPTRPVTLGGRLAFARDKKGWYARLWERIDRCAAEAQIFINYPRELPPLAPRKNRILWLTDGPRPRPGELDPFGRVCLSDPGYVGEVKAALAAESFGGEVSFGYCPAVHAPRAPEGRREGACFIGNRDPKRDRYLAALFQAGHFPLVVGNYFLHHPFFWRHPLNFRPAVSNQAMGRIYGRHQLSLNIHAEVVREGTNMRTFECAAYGIAQLVEKRPGLERFFDLERELAVFSEETELVEKLAELLAAPERAKALAHRARQRVLAEHSYYHRAVQLLDGVLPAAVLRGRLQAAMARWSSSQGGSFR
ncbi:CgeB family protein [Desulfuromonas sp. DDH964]|uniref:CgeB family protein n=1 Tax=Desulfuromonas sp. DDH964 TaxID=1823759 RepID=UPI0012F81A4F|nr:glycosyltransferase [Desulfuromonas sp. DDH964]